MVINVKWGVYAAVAALLLAFAISISIGQASFAAAFLRALLFAALFFVLGVGTWTLINTFIPELLFPEAHDAAANIFGSESGDSQSSDSQSYGSHINITLGDKSEAALPDSNESGSEEVGNIADLVSGAVDPAEESKKQRGLDEIGENSYTGRGEDAAPSMSDFAEPLPAEDSGGFTMNFDSFALGGGLEPFGDSFSIPGDAGGTARDGEASLPERKVTGNKPMTLEGDFNPKDIAAGIRTVLETDKRG
ncbi:MAG: hypothetical protein LBU85_11440 [Treponema sp.]|jgi:hypothetical protein|nr:hypothetical protein [Treponema sp.]